MAEFIRERHQDHAAKTRLHIFLGRVLGKAGEDFGELRFECRERVTDRNLQTADAEIIGEREGVIDAAARRIGTGHGDPKDVFRA